MSTIFIFHGTEGYPEENWFPWLKKECEKKGFDVVVPQFPSPPVVPAKISEWFDVLRTYEEKITKETILVGHSLGGIFALRVLERLSHPVSSCFLVGTPVGVKPIRNFERDSGFSGFEFDWENIRKKSSRFFVFQSDNDPYVSKGNGEKLAERLYVPLSFVPGAGHFNTAAGYREFTQLLAMVVKA
jgi:predicted alpha/beta hydrolase family esterase